MPPAFGAYAMLYMAAREAARQCVALRLRTHFGGPSQTFAAVEKALQVCVALC